MSRALPVASLRLKVGVEKLSSQLCGAVVVKIFSRIVSSVRVSGVGKSVLPAVAI